MLQWQRFFLFGWCFDRLWTDFQFRWGFVWKAVLFCNLLKWQFWYLNQSQHFSTGWWKHLPGSKHPPVSQHRGVKTPGKAAVAGHRKVMCRSDSERPLSFCHHCHHHSHRILIAVYGYLHMYHVWNGYSYTVWKTLFHQSKIRSFLYLMEPTLQVWVFRGFSIGAVWGLHCMHCMHEFVCAHQCPLFARGCLCDRKVTNQFFLEFPMSSWTAHNTKMLAKEAKNTEDRLVGWWSKVIQHTARLHSTSKFLHSTRGHINHVDCTQWHPWCVCHTSTFWRYWRPMMQILTKTTNKQKLGRAKTSSADLAFR